MEIAAMRLPNAEAALVDIDKIRDYCLSADHPRGKHKARVFAAALGLTAENSEELIHALHEAVLRNEAVAGVSDEFGERFIVDFAMKRNGKTTTIRSCWIVLNGGQRPRFATCFLL
jgi:hypothetical protein